MIPGEAEKESSSSRKMLIIKGVNDKRISD